MRRAYFIVVIMFFTLSYVHANTQDEIQKGEKNDTIQVHTLQEAVVEGQSKYITATKSVYIPSQKDKETSYDAHSLLERMMIPEIMAIPESTVVTTLAGQNVSIFINFLPADYMDQSALYTKDVTSVEYLDHPDDPRFHGAEYVINFIVKEYKYGGYTKLNDRVNFMNKVRNELSLYQRLVYKKWTLDLYSSYNYNYNTHSGVNEYSIFHFPRKDDSFKEIIRETKLIDAKQRFSNEPISLRLTYKTDRTTLRNSFGFSHESQPDIHTNGGLWISEYPENTEKYSQNRNSNFNSFTWDGDYYFDLSNGWELSIKNNFAHTYSRKSNEYVSDYINEAIVNNTRERAYDESADASLEKKINSNHSLSLDLSGGIQYNHIDYLGDYPAVEHFSSPRMSGDLGYWFSRGKIYAGVKLGFEWNGTKVNGFKHYETTPFANLNFSYAFTGRSSLRFFGQYCRAGANASSYAPTLIQNNEFLYTQGNPNLKQYNLATAQLSYTYYPSMRVYFSAYAKYSGYYDRITSYYLPVPDYDIILKSFKNGGNFQSYEIGGQVGFGIPGKLMCSIRPNLGFVHTPTTQSKDYTLFEVSGWAQYYFGNFYAHASYITPSKSIGLDEPVRLRYNSSYSLGVGWGAKGWNLSFIASNIFKKGYDYKNSTIESPYYYNYATHNSYYGHCNFTLRVTYTIGYGKKIDSSNEIDKLDGAKSATLN